MQLYWTLNGLFISNYFKIKLLERKEHTQGLINTEEIKGWLYEYHTELLIFLSFSIAP